MICTIVYEIVRNTFLYKMNKRDRPLRRIKQDTGVKTADAGEDFGGGR